MRMTVLSVLIMLGVVISGCAPAATATPAPVTVAPSATAQPTATAVPVKVPTTLAEVPRITAEELKARLDADENVIIVDARPGEEYRERHVLGALSMPLAEVEERHGELSRAAEIVLYCT